MALESDIDALYKLPPAKFTAARNALAKSLTGDEAERVKRLQKAAVVPWAINQVYWQERRVYERLLETGHAVRDTQMRALTAGASSASGGAGAPGNDVRKASLAHRKALGDAVHHAVRLAAKFDLKPDAEQLAQTFEALSLAGRPPAEPGRLTETLQPAGFDALADLKNKKSADSRKRG